MNASADPILPADCLLVLPADAERHGPNSRDAELASDTDRATKRAAQLIRASRAPALVGLEMLSIEAIREAVALAEQINGRLLPDRGFTVAAQSVVQAATLGEIYHCDRLVWVGDQQPSSPVAAAVAARNLPTIHVPADLRTPRDWMLQGCEEKALSARRLGVILPPLCDPRTAALWHRLAAHWQTQRRVLVFQLPDRHAANWRSVVEVVAWQTGLSIERGGVEFTAAGPRRCADLQSLLASHSIDLLLDFRCHLHMAGASMSRVPTRRICFNAHDAAADLCVKAPSLVPGTRARVMRCDGVVLWLSQQPDAAPPDAAAQWLARLRQTLEPTP